MERTLSYAPDVWKLLNGILCVYKPPLMTSSVMMQTLTQRICDDLNQMKVRSPSRFVELKRLEPGEELPDNPDVNVISVVPDEPARIVVVERTNYADHPLVVGPRYCPEDIKYKVVNAIGQRVSGICLVGLNRDARFAQKLIHSQWLRTYHVSGQFGIATNTGFTDGSIREKATYHKITQSLIENIAASSQSSHQRLMFKAHGISLDSQRAFELASEGLVRPQGLTLPVVYSLKLLKFTPPNFVLEIKSINETPSYFARLVHEMGLKMRSVAACSKIRCVKYGPFELEHSIVERNWDVKNVLVNLLENAKIIKLFNFKQRDPWVRSNKGNMADRSELELAGVDGTLEFIGRFSQ